jgi:TonB-dependent SusC/RagA subfamily outer membrane receptor
MSPSSPKSVAAMLLVVGMAACTHPAASTPGGSQAAAPQRNRNAVIDSTTIASAAGQPIEKIIADNVSGVKLAHAADGSLALQIRGSASWTSDGQPLYVIDGVSMSQGANLAGINPMDIATIEVLKDATSTSMYGSRGANGVVLIKMKKR